MKKYLLLFIIIIVSVVLLSNSTFDFKFDVVKSSPSFLLDKKIERKIDALLEELTLEEKIGQTCQITLSSVLQKNLDGKMIVPHIIDTAKLNEAINTYKIGSILNVADGPEGPTFDREKWKSIINKCRILVFDRQGYKAKSFRSIAFKRANNKSLTFVNFKKVNISSSQLRKI